MLHKANEKKNNSELKPLILHNANCIVCNAKIQLTANPDNAEPICYNCYQEMWGKHGYKPNQSLKKAAGN